VDRSSGAGQRRIKGPRGKALGKRRAEIAERSNAHCYETGGLRRVHVRRRLNVEKRILIQAATYNLALMMRTLLGAGTPKGLSQRFAAAFGHTLGLRRASQALAALAHHILAAMGLIDDLTCGPAAVGSAR